MDATPRQSALIFWLTMRIDFIRYFYAKASAEFFKIQRKIEAYEEPYDYYSGDDDDGFQADWELADGAIDVLGMHCLSMLTQLLTTFCHSFLKEMGGQALVNHLGHFKKTGSALEQHRAFVHRVKSGIRLGIERRGSRSYRADGSYSEQLCPWQ